MSQRLAIPKATISAGSRALLLGLAAAAFFAVTLFSTGAWQSPTGIGRGVRLCASI